MDDAISNLEMFAGASIYGLNDSRLSFGYMLLATDGRFDRLTPLECLTRILSTS